MKNVKHLFMAVCLAAFFFTSCSKQTGQTVEELDPVKDAALIASIEKSAEPGIPFPEGSRAFADGKDRMRIVLPDGYYFAMLTGRDEYLEPADGDGDGEAGITCTCTSGSGCNPVKFRGKYYCVISGGCNSCDKKASRISGEAVHIAGVYNPGLGITLLTRNKATGLKAGLTSTKDGLLGNAYPALFRIKGVQEELQQLYNFIYGDNIPAFITQNSAVLPMGYRYAAVSIYGNLAAIPVPESMTDKDFYLLGADGGASCRCNDVPASGGCKKDSFLGAVYCDAGNCKSCSLLD